jgi:hypothetical protein
MEFDKKQVERYGKEKMMEWLNSLPDKLKHRIDFVAETGQERQLT